MLNFGRKREIARERVIQREREIEREKERERDSQTDGNKSKTDCCSYKQTDGQSDKQKDSQ